jgi:hypothetical protein
MAIMSDDFNCSAGSRYGAGGGVEASGAPAVPWCARTVFQGGDSVPEPSPRPLTFIMLIIFVLVWGVIEMLLTLWL